MNYTLVLIKVEKREDDSVQVQKILTDFGCSIRVRLGLHDLPEGACSPAGLILLEVTAEDKETREFVEKLNALTSVTAKMVTI